MKLVARSPFGLLSNISLMRNFALDIFAREKLSEESWNKVPDEEVEKINIRESLKFLSKYDTNNHRESLSRSRKWVAEKRTDIILDTIKNYRKLVLSDKSYKNLSNYKAPSDIRIDVLKTLPNRKDMIQINSETSLKYKKTDTYLSILFLFISSKTKKLDTFFVYIDIISGHVFHDETLSDELEVENKGTFNVVTNNDVIIKYKEMVEKFYSLFMVCITYIELTDVTLNICLANSKRGNILKNDILKNELPYDVIQVNTNWNISKIHIGDKFEVKGHYRLAPHGTADNKYYKYIFIDTYQKTGIIKRKAGKEIN